MICIYWQVVRDFCCIEFLQKDGEDPYYDAVPSFWISEDERSCRYPAVENVAMVKKLAKQYVKPEDMTEWKTVDINVHSTGYGNVTYLYVRVFIRSHLRFITHIIMEYFLLVISDFLMTSICDPVRERKTYIMLPNFL